MEKKEIWRDIKDYEGSYQVSNLGRVKSLDRIVEYKDGRVFNYKGKIKSFGNCKGYYIVNLVKNSKQKAKRVSRLVAEAFIPNPDNLPEVNHKDEVKTNNKVDNLEWCTSKYNSNFGTKNERSSMKNRKKIIGVNIVDNTDITFESITMAGENGYSVTGICNNLNGRSKSSGGLRWYYIDDYMLNMAI